MEEVMSLGSIILSVASSLIAQGDIPDVGGLQGWLQIATSTGFVGLAWYLIVISLPKMQARFDAHSERQMAEFVRQVEKLTDNHAAIVKQIGEQHEKHLDRVMSLAKVRD